MSATKHEAARLTQWGTATLGCSFAHTPTVATAREPATGSAQATAPTHRTACAEGVALGVAARHGASIAPNDASREVCS